MLHDDFKECQVSVHRTLLATTPLLPIVWAEYKKYLGLVKLTNSEAFITRTSQLQSKLVCWKVVLLTQV